MNFGFAPPSSTTLSSNPSSLNFGNGAIAGGQPQSRQPAHSGSGELATLASHPFQYIQQSFDPMHPGYRFRAIFYNAVVGEGPSGDINASALTMNKPPNVPDRLWQQAVSDNPDPKRLLPVIAHGPQDLDKRAASQREHWLAYCQKDRELKHRLAHISDDSDREGGLNLPRLRERQVKLTLRLLAVQRRLDGLWRRNQPLDEHERAALERLQSLANQLAGHTGDLPGIIQQLQAIAQVDKSTQVEDSGDKREDAPQLNSSVASDIDIHLAQQARQITDLLGHMDTVQQHLDIMQAGYCP